MPKNEISAEGKYVHSLVPVIAYVISVLIISGATLIASIIYASPDYPQFRKPIEYLGYALLAVVCVGLLTKAGFDIYAEFFSGRRQGIRTELKKILKFLRRYALPTVLGVFLLGICGLCLGYSPLKLASDFFKMALSSLREIGHALINLLEAGRNLFGICIILLLVGLLSFLIGKLPIRCLIRRKGHLAGGMKSARSLSLKSNSRSAFDLLPSEQATKLMDLNFRLHGPILQHDIKCVYPTHAKGSSQCWLQLKWDSSSGGKWIYAEEEFMKGEDENEYAHGKVQE
jgi:hypothetical protein